MFCDAVHHSSYTFFVRPGWKLYKAQENIIAIAFCTNEKPTPCCFVTHSNGFYEIYLNFWGKLYTLQPNNSFCDYESPVHNVYNTPASFWLGWW